MSAFSLQRNEVSLMSDNQSITILGNPMATHNNRVKYHHAHAQSTDDSKSKNDRTINLFQNLDVSVEKYVFQNTTECKLHAEF